MVELLFVASVMATKKAKRVLHFDTEHSGITQSWLPNKDIVET